MCIYAFVGTYRLERGRSAETMTAPASAFHSLRSAGVVGLTSLNDPRPSPTSTGSSPRLSRGCAHALAHKHPPAPGRAFRSY